MLGGGGDDPEGLVGGIGERFGTPRSVPVQLGACWGWVLPAGRLSGPSSRTRSPTSGFRAPSAAAFRFWSLAAGAGMGSRGVGGGGGGTQKLGQKRRPCTALRLLRAAPSSAWQPGDGAGTPGWHGGGCCGGFWHTAGGVGGGRSGRCARGEGGNAAARLAGSGSVRGDSDQVRNSSRHAIYHRRCSWKSPYKCISAARSRGGTEGMGTP